MDASGARINTSVIPIIGVNPVFSFSGASAASVTGAILLEDGTSYLLLENGSKILME